ncbi:SpoIIE family protein phosphatase [bacterium]|nr:SpoIIE family protein phosphatase [candidate division CSSED10-310 bacterium]
MKWLTGYVPKERSIAYVLGSGIMCLSHYGAAESPFFNPVLFLFGIIFIGFSATSRKPPVIRNTHSATGDILVPSAVFIAIETIRCLIPAESVRELVAIAVSIPLATLTAFAVFRLMSALKTWFGRLVFLFFLFLVFITRDPSINVLAFMTLLAAAPFSWPGRLEKTDFQRLLIPGIALLTGWIAIENLAKGPILDPQVFGFMAGGTYALGSVLMRIFIYSAILVVIWRLSKPMHIRSRLRWAFLLNFMIPFALLLVLSAFSVVFLVGGYNATAAQRVIRQYGAEAGYQAQKLYEAFQGLGTPPPGEVPFRRVAFVRLTDGAERAFGNIHEEIVRWLDGDRHRTVEFISISNGDEWEFWVAGYFRDTGGAGAVLAYQVDETMLNRVRDTTGMELLLVKGQSLPWEPWPSAPFIASSGIDTSSRGEDLFNAGAAMFYLPSVQSTIELAATLKVYGTRTQFLKSLILNQMDSSGLVSSEENRPVKLDFGTVTSDSLNLENVNIWNLLLFMILIGLLGVLAALVVLSLSTSFLISRRINRSVKVLKDGTTALNRGDLTYRIPIVSGDELGELARDFNQMIESIKEYTEERETFLLQQVEKERLENDLETARILQQSLLPGGPIDEHPALEIAASFQPMEEVGGDYYDYLWFRDQGIGLVIGDVSGHGMSAGLLMVMAKSCLVNQVRTAPGIRDVMTAINNMILDTFKKKRLMTFQYAVFTPDGSRMRFASAGHQFPYLYRTATGHLEELESISYPLGVRRELKLDVQEVALDEDDCVIMFTDGLVEAVNTDNEQLGYDRLREIFSSITCRSAKEAVQAVMARIDAYRNGAGQVDDMTLVVVRRRQLVAEVESDGE